MSSEQAEALIATCRRTGQTTLDLPYLGLTELPETIGQLTELTTLYLDGNELTDLPDAIGRLRHLCELVLTENRLAQLPDAIGELPNLTRLRLNRNKLTGLADIGRLTELTTLHLDHNRLRWLPLELSATALSYATVGIPTIGLGQLKLGPAGSNRFDAQLRAAASSGLDELWLHL